MEFKVWGTNVDCLVEESTFEEFHNRFLSYVFLKDIEADSMIEACRQARESERHDYRYLRVTGDGFAVEFDSEAEFPEGELIAALRR